jgi:AcrR family transcriptional regulator
MATEMKSQAGKSRKSNSTPAVPNTRRGPLQREYLLGVVYDLISEFGIEALTMRQVAEASNVSTGTINYHFKNKQNLIIAALEAAYQLPEDWEQYKGSPAAQLRRITLSYVLRATSDRWWRFWINYLAYSTRDAEMQAHQAVRYERQRGFWANLISDGIRKGEFRPDLDPHATAQNLLIATHGLVTLQFMNADAETRSFARDHINGLVDQLLA